MIRWKSAKRYRLGAAVRSGRLHYFNAERRSFFADRNPMYFRGILAVWPHSVSQQICAIVRHTFGMYHFLCPWHGCNGCSISYLIGQKSIRVPIKQAAKLLFLGAVGMGATSFLSTGRQRPSQLALWRPCISYIPRSSRWWWSLFFIKSSPSWIRFPWFYLLVACCLLPISIQGKHGISWGSWLRFVPAVPMHFILSAMTVAGSTVSPFQSSCFTVRWAVLPCLACFR